MEKDAVQKEIEKELPLSEIKKRRQLEKAIPVTLKLPNMFFKGDLYEADLINDEEEDYSSSSFRNKE